MLNNIVNIYDTPSLKHMFNLSFHEQQCCDIINTTHTYYLLTYTHINVIIYIC